MSPTDVPEDLGCPHCKAAPGEGCFTSTGKPATYVHAARFDAWRNAAEPVPNEWPGWPSWPPEVTP